MLKRISYILILVMTLFVFNSVKALNTIRYPISDGGKIKGFTFDADSNGRFIGLIDDDLSIHCTSEGIYSEFTVDSTSLCPISINEITISKVDIYPKYSPHEVCPVYELNDNYYNRINGSGSSEPYNNYEEDAKKSCGSGRFKINGIPSIIPSTVSTIYLIIQIVIPVVLVILGILDLLKAISADKEDNMKKAQSLFFKRLIYAVLVFFVFAIVKLAVSFATKDSNGLVSCMNCFIRNDCTTESK